MWGNITAAYVVVHGGRWTQAVDNMKPHLLVLGRKVLNKKVMDAHPRDAPFENTEEYSGAGKGSGFWL